MERIWEEKKKTGAVVQFSGRFNMTFGAFFFFSWSSAAAAARASKIDKMSQIDSSSGSGLLGSAALAAAAR